MDIFVDVHTQARFIHPKSSGANNQALASNTRFTGNGRSFWPSEFSSSPVRVYPSRGVVEVIDAPEYAAGLDEPDSLVLESGVGEVDDGVQLPEWAY